MSKVKLGSEDFHRPLLKAGDKAWSGSKAQRQAVERVANRYKFPIHKVLSAFAR